MACDAFRGSRCVVGLGGLTELRLPYLNDQYRQTREYGEQIPALFLPEQKKKQLLLLLAYLISYGRPQEPWRRQQEPLPPFSRAVMPGLGEPGNFFFLGEPEMVFALGGWAFVMVVEPEVVFDVGGEPL